MIGRLNHVAIAVPDLSAAAEQYRSALGAKVGAPQDEPDHGEPRIGAHGKPVLFLHPKDFNGCLVELEQV
jgi:catechol 2,3-dioxygenase-like lactoylglutathione lyase family enzyme